MNENEPRGPAEEQDEDAALWREDDPGEVPCALRLREEPPADGPESTQPDDAEPDGMGEETEPDSLNGAMNTEPNALPGLDPTLRARAEQEAGRALEHLRALDPALQSVNDLADPAGRRELMRLVEERGLSLEEAYKLTHFDRLLADCTRQAEQRGRQSALNQSRGLAHLPAAPGGARAPTQVPPDVMEEYRKMMPQWSEAQIRAHYHRCTGK